MVQVPAQGLSGHLFEKVAEIVRTHMGHAGQRFDIQFFRVIVGYEQANALKLPADTLILIINRPVQ